MKTGETSPFSYSFFERILRLAVFRLSVASNPFESFMMRLYFYWATSRTFFNPRRAESTLNFLKSMGAEERFVRTKDNETIHALFFRASAFEEVVRSHGGEWIEIELQGQKAFGIVNRKHFSNWDVFEAKLRRFGWNKYEMQGEEVFITSFHAEELLQDQKNLFLHLHSNSVAMTMITKRIGFYLGAKQDFCLFDPRGTWKSSGIPSEAGYYRDIEAVYEQIVEKEFPKHTLWLSGYCSGAYPAAYLWKELQNKKGKCAHLILENSAADLLADFVGSLSLLIRWFATRYWNGLKRNRDSEEENGFSLSACWKNLPTVFGTVLVIYPENDQRITRSAQNKLKEIVSSIADRSNSISFYSQSYDPHSDAFFHYPESAKKYWNVVRNSSNNEIGH